MSSSNDIKICILGSAAVGKTCLLYRFVKESFLIGSSSTIGVAYQSQKIQLPNSGAPPITLGLWDTAGAEIFNSLSALYTRNSQIALVCFDPQEEKTFKEAQRWISSLKSDEPKCKIFLIATKMDLLGSKLWCPSESSVVAWARENGITQVHRTSALTGQGCKEVYKSLCEVATHIFLEETPSGRISVEVSRPPQESCSC
ncbi:hypothetical protein RCL1_001796 [Eukaryota sp. TZLM3-RCL]